MNEIEVMAMLDMGQGLRKPPARIPFGRIGL
jgi:hypothetical protein